MRLISFIYPALTTLVLGSLVTSGESAPRVLPSEPQVINASTIALYLNRDINEWPGPLASLPQDKPSTSDATGADDTDWSLRLYQDNNYKGYFAYYADTARMGACERTVVGTSSIEFIAHPRQFYCLFWDDENCDHSKTGLYVPESYPILWYLGWEDRIRSVQCYWA
ncbi:hypothetical protein K505DRAFT_333699 [Melanomma pulvis-pyrius CBS 109.77]|uniref:AA1-like domain-containing protein n=1 Tax=Melanomma pulvis-pyrius CBS 109.77 TaxID=1314802 RepID=A0A6A6XNZ8_9PLEO|nr:hypothetical protein K505DRAFT_333699 [Melanomma pulvis-pyrius CBS 109.77]